MANAAPQFVVERAKRTDALLRLALQATSNGGKTWSAIEVGFGIVEELLARGILKGSIEGKVGVVDTERKSSRLYAHLGPFDTVNLTPPYTIERYRGAMEALERTGVEVIVLDQISHAWAGPGGLRALLATFSDKDKFSAYDTTINPAQDEFIDMMLRSRCHLIATMRCKTEWVLEDKTTKSGYTVKAPRRIGMAPIQRPGIEYEFTTLLDLDTDTHVARVLKNRCPVFDDWVPKKLTREHGRLLASWLLEAEPDPRPPVPGTPLERAQAVRDAALRAVESSANGPDLSRVFADAFTTLKGFYESVDGPAVDAMIEELIAAKDTRKATLGLPSAARVAEADVLDPAVADALEQMLRKVGIPVDKALEHLGMTALRLIPRDRLQVFLSWVDATGQHIDQIPMPAPLAALGLKWPAPHKFDDMEDDIPF